MELACITFHDLSEDATILFASESVFDILGYHPQDILGRSCFEYFHPGEEFYAKTIYNRGLWFKSASDLYRVRVRTRDDNYITCECYFTVVNDILAACSRVYYRGGRAHLRAVQATQISHIFSRYPKDPQPHPSKLPFWAVHIHPIEENLRAALILDRFTRSLTILSASNKAGQILASQLEHLKDKSFYNYIMTKTSRMPRNV
ncbi:hypothetical protein V8C42DRAFT_302455 [Trichoderma barbatum]